MDANRFVSSSNNGILHKFSRINWSVQWNRGHMNPNRNSMHDFNIQTFSVRFSGSESICILFYKTPLELLRQLLDSTFTSSMFAELTEASMQPHGTWANGPLCKPFPVHVFEDETIIRGGNSIISYYVSMLDFYRYSFSPRFQNLHVAAIASFSLVRPQNQLQTLHYRVGKQQLRLQIAHFLLEKLQSIVIGTRSDLFILNPRWVKTRKLNVGIIQINSLQMLRFQKKVVNYQMFCKTKSTVWKRIWHIKVELPRALKSRFQFWNCLLKIHPNVPFPFELLLKLEFFCCLFHISEMLA